MKKRKSGILVKVLIGLGVLMIISPLAGRYYTQWQEKRLLDEWYNSVDADGSETQAGMPANPEEGYEQLQAAFAGEGNADGEGTSVSGNMDTVSGSAAAAKAAATKKQLKSQKVLGIIKIDKLDLKYPVVEGVKARNLRIGIGHIPGTSGLGKLGNCVLAGHRNYTFGRFFNRLDELKEGDMISISDKKAEYRYRINKKFVVKPNDLSVLKGGKDETVLTLITCTPIYIASHRLIVQARLEETILSEP